VRRSRLACLDISVECVEYGISVIYIYWSNVGQGLDLNSACKLLVGKDVRVVSQEVHTLFVLCISHLDIELLSTRLDCIPSR
jgi:hypothetical protein